MMHLHTVLRTVPFILAFPAFQAAAQHQTPDPLPCLANDPRILGTTLTSDPEALARIAATDAALEQFTRDFVPGSSRGGGSTYLVPVVFHIIHQNGVENISDAQVEDAIRVANLDFNKQNADWPSVNGVFLDIVADVGMEFQLARKDPDGNCTKGITRTVSPLTHVGDQDMKELIQWPPDRYLNVWVCAYANGAAGYAVYPSTADNSPERDGIVLRHDYVGSIGTGAPSRSRTFTHEIGHWANLRHVWGNSNDAGLPENCDTDDNVADTPNTVGSQPCIPEPISCGSLDNVENYMEYASCRKMFTNGQGARMLAAMNSGVADRNDLWSPANLLATGLSSEPELCAAEFTSTGTSICAGSSVTFTDLSYHGVVLRTWSFPGGTPATSSDPVVTVTYDEPGTYPVSMTVGDGSNELTAEAPDYVTVFADPGAEPPLQEGFEGLSELESPAWTVANPDADNTYTVTNAAAFSGTRSVRIVNTAAMEGRTDDLYSSTYDLSAAEQVVITFRYAFAQRTATDDDRLRLYVSNNCGTSWSMRRQLRGASDLNTAGAPVVSGFVPGSDQWGYAEVSNISTNYHVSDFRIRFEFESYGGNNVYIDDININGEAVGLEEWSGNGSPVSVVPNPAAGAAELRFMSATGGTVAFDVLDMTGRLLQQRTALIVAPGENRVPLPVAQLPAGSYLLRFFSPEGSQAARFTVER